MALGSYLLLFTINPDLIKIVDLSMPSIEPISNYCGEKQTVSLTQDNPTEFGLLPTDHFTGIDGSEARCGFNYSQSIEGNDYKCMGISCKHKGQNFICYNGKCLTPFTACWEEGSKLFKLSEFSMWSGEMKSGWNGEIPMDLPEGIDGACYRYTLFKSNISLKLGDLITGNNELYYYRWAYDKDINETISKIETGGATCESMNLKYVVQYKACQKSSHCTFSRNGMIETACINANAN